MHSRSSDADTLPLDPLSEVLQDLRMTGVSYDRCELTRPWGIEFPPQGPARFHFVAEGDAWLHAGATGWVQLRAGDVVLVPRGTGHALADTPDRPTREIDSLPRECVGGTSFQVCTGGGGERALLFGGSVALAEPALHPLLDLMPPVLHVRDAATSDPSLPALLQTMADEVAAQRIGAATVLARLADVVVARLVRAWVEARCGEATGWLAAIRDPQVGRVLAAIHRRPGEPWTVTSLARVAQASRSSFAERFAAAVGMPPARYLTRWRMHVASGWLQHERTTVSEAATRLGYESEPAFSRAFKRVVGIPPSALRRAERAPERVRAAPPIVEPRGGSSTAAD
jgi:AraC-like DNA-binding protein